MHRTRTRYLAGEGTFQNIGSGLCRWAAGGTAHGVSWAWKMAHGGLDPKHCFISLESRKCLPLASRLRAPFPHLQNEGCMPHPESCKNNIGHFMYLHKYKYLKREMQSWLQADAAQGSTVTASLTSCSRARQLSSFLICRLGVRMGAPSTV